MGGSKLSKKVWDRMWTVPKGLSNISWHYFCQFWTPPPLAVSLPRNISKRPPRKKIFEAKSFRTPFKRKFGSNNSHTLVHFPVYLRSLKDHLYCSLWWGASVFTSRWKGKRIESWYDLLRIAGKWTKVCVTASYKKPQQFLIVHSHPKNPT